LPDPTKGSTERRARVCAKRAQPQGLAITGIDAEDLLGAQDYKLIAPTGVHENRGTVGIFESVGSPDDASGLLFVRSNPLTLSAADDDQFIPVRQRV
jgi:hypothetical protein